jgi:hypothetical protein
MFSISLTRADHIRRYSIGPPEGSGWEVKVEADQELTRHAYYRDWHRVERTLAIFRLEVSELIARGWTAIT